jgi:hypothetical protein
MDETNRPLPRFSPLRVVQISAAASLALLVLFAWIYFAKPIPDSYWNDKATDFLIILASASAALAATRVAGLFERDEAPWRIWWAFAIGFWCWLAGELSGLVYDAMYWETQYPDLTLIDLFWIMGYLFLGLSLYYQYRLIYSTPFGGGRQNKRGTRYYLALVALAFLLTAILTNLAANAGLGEGYAWIVLFITVLYPVFDLTEGAAAIRLSLLFGRGQWGRPWWGLILFALSDSINSFYWLGGYQWLGAGTQKVFDIITNMTYPAAYLVAGLALLSNYYMIKHGEAVGLTRPVKKVPSADSQLETE